MSDTEPLPNSATLYGAMNLRLEPIIEEDSVARGLPDYIVPAKPVCQKVEISRIDSARAWHLESIFVDFETLDFRIERSRRQT
jgi:hypothetical protein